MSEDELAGWHLRCNEHNLGQTLGDDEGQSVLQSMGSQGVGHDWVTEQQQKSQQRQKMKGGPLRALLHGPQTQTLFGP